jgi:hypothetical protein
MKRQSTVKRTSNEPEFERMKAQMDKYQSEAGDKFYELYHKSHYGVPAMDPSKEPVDGGKHSYEIPDHVIDCQNILGRASRELGMLNYAIVHKIIAEEIPSDQIAVELGDNSKRGGDRVRFQFRNALTVLAVHWDIKRPEHRRSSYFSRDSRPEMFSKTTEST